MPQVFLAGFAAGLASAILLASASAGGMSGRMILFFLAPLPCYLAGFGWGTYSGAFAATTSAVIVSGLLGAKTGAIFFLSQGIPLIVLCYLTFLNRPAEAANNMPVPAAAPHGGAPQAPQLEWYPIGRIVVAATLMAGTLVVGSMLLLAQDMEQLQGVIRELVDKSLVKEMPRLGRGELGEEEIKALVQLLVFALPAASAVLWLGGFVLNLWLAGRITQISGRLTRPWPDLTSLRYPRLFGIGLAGALLLTGLGGYTALLARGFAGAFLFAYLLVGLAIIHRATLGQPARPFILWGVYMALLFLNAWAGLAIALIGVVEPLSPWRRPPDDNGPPPPSGSNRPPPDN